MLVADKKIPIITPHHQQPNNQNNGHCLPLLTSLQRILPRPSQGVTGGCRRTEEVRNR